MTRSQSVIVVGGGSIGISIAWELARRGLRVTLLERSRIGRGTTWAGAGILPPANRTLATDPIDQLRGLSHQLFPEWAEALKAGTGIDCELERCGGWYLADTPGERASLIGMTSYWRELEIQCDPVPLDELADREAGLRPWVEHNPGAAAFWVPDEYQLRPPRFTAALRQACEDAGVEIIEECAVEAIEPRSSSARVRAGQQWREADHVVLSAGVWSGQVAEQLGLQRSLIPVRGQILLFKTNRRLLQSIVNLGQRYLVPRQDGHVLVGSCEEETGFELGTTERVLDALRHLASSVLPQLTRDTEVRAWSGLRPLTFDGFPMIGHVPNHPTVLVAAGHYRSGLHLAPATAVCIADLATGQTPPLPLDIFSVGKQQFSANHDLVNETP